MADLQCVICDYKVVDLTPDDELLSLLGATPGEAGPLLIQHMETHSLIDWIKAFKMADAYIEQLEAQLAAARLPTLSAPRGGIDYQREPAFAGDQQAWANEQAQIAREDYLDADPNDAELLRRYTPREVAAIKRRRQITQVIQSHDPDETLIPRIPDAQRPEGVVGVKY